MIEADDDVIFSAARDAGVDLVMTKDRDFADLVDRLGPPPKVIWLTIGNTSTVNLKRILSETLRDALDMIERGESLVEISQRLPERGNEGESP
jgi:predicted nuclease of predicted toxin-antitoxin system